MRAIYVDIVPGERTMKAFSLELYQVQMKMKFSAGKNIDKTQ